MARLTRAMATATATATISALALLIYAPDPAAAQSNSILDRVRERAASRAQTTTENRANEQVDQTVDKTVDCMFSPVECAKQKSHPAPAPGEAGATPAPDATEWYAEKNGERVGPMPRDQLASMVTSGQLTTSTLVWREGLSEWKPAGDVAELGDVFKKVPPPLPALR